MNTSNNELNTSNNELNTSNNGFSFNAARFDSTASNRIKSLADYLKAQREENEPRTRQAALDSLVPIAARKGVDMGSVKLLKAALGMSQKYIDKVLHESKGADLEAVEIAAAKTILGDMSKKIALESAGFAVEWKE